MLIELLTTAILTTTPGSGELDAGDSTSASSTDRSPHFFEEAAMSVPLLEAEAPAVEPSATPSSSAGPRAVPSVEQQVAPSAPTPPSAGTTRLGVLMDVGVPDGAGLQLVFRPFWFLRAQGGYTTNGIGHGVKGGVTLVPWEFPIIPVLSLEAGHSFGGDASLLRMTGVDVPRELTELGRRISYQFYTAHVGLDIGSHRRFLVSLRAGISRVNATIEGLEADLREMSGSDTLEAGPVEVRLGMPTAKIGLTFFFL